MCAHARIEHARGCTTVASSSLAIISGKRTEMKENPDTCRRAVEALATTTLFSPIGAHLKSPGVATRLEFLVSQLNDKGDGGGGSKGIFTVKWVGFGINIYVRGVLVVVFSFSARA